MTEPPPRKRFQIHLSTAIVMMFVAGGLIWANIRAHWTEQPQSNHEIISLPGYGWPWIAFDKGAWHKNYFYESNYDLFFDELSPSMIALDFGVAYLILLATWFLCEWLIRRRAARRGA